MQLKSCVARAAVGARDPAVWIASVCSSAGFSKTESLSLSQEHFVGPEQMSEEMHCTDLDRKHRGQLSQFSVRLFCIFPRMIKHNSLFLL